MADPAFKKVDSPAADSPGASSGDSARSGASRSRVTASCVDLLYRSTPIVTANLLCALLLAVAAFEALPHGMLAAWLAAIVVLNVGRAGLRRHYLRRNTPASDAHRWGLYYAIGSGLSGLLWAAAVVMAFQYGSIALHAVAIVIVAGLAAGVTTSATSFLPAYFAFTVPTSIAVIASLLTVPQREYIVMGAALMLFAVLVSLIARRMNQTLTESIELRLNNQALVEDLTEALDTIKEANRAKSEFLANMSHELRTPLNAIIGFSGMIMSEALGPIGGSRYREYARDIQESGAHLLGLISNILDVSKIEAGQVELRPTEVAIQDVVQSCITIIKDTARAERIALAVEIEPELPVLFADEVKLKQVLINLLSNSVKFTQAGGTVSVKVRLNDDGRYTIAVADTGVGIAREDIPKALAAFHQLDNDRQGKNQGTGLGLTLAKSLVELHGGTLELESEIGVGTTVTLIFPPSCIAATPPAVDRSPERALSA